MIKYVRNRLKKSMGTGRVQTPTPAGNPETQPQANWLKPQNELGNTNRSTGGLIISGQQRTDSISSSSIGPVASVQGNMTESMGGWPPEQASRPLDWNLAIQTHASANPAKLVKWIVIVAEECAESVHHSIRDMMISSEPNKYEMLAFQIVKLGGILIPNYLQNIENAHEDGKDFQMCFVILSDERQDLYYTVKECLRNLEFPSACVCGIYANPENLLFIAKEKKNEICKRFGGMARSWPNKVLLNSIMFVGFDVYQAKGSTISTSSIVSTVVDHYYFAVTSTRESEDELSRNHKVNIKKCCKAYKGTKGSLPNKIVIFRGEVEVEKLGYIKTSELPQILDALQTLYGAEGKQIPKLSYILVAKKNNSRMLSEVKKIPDNFPPGTVVDSNVTLPLRYDFFLSSLGIEEGVKLSSFLVLYNTLGFTPKHFELMTEKMCHLSFDWSGYIIVPIPCLYAYRLAFLFGMSFEKEAYHYPEHNIMTFV